MKHCSVCGRTFYTPSSDILPGKDVCPQCDENVRHLANSENIDEKKAAAAYLQKCTNTASDEATRTAIVTLLNRFPEVNEKEADERSLLQSWQDASIRSQASGQALPYIVYQVTLKEKFLGTGSKNLTDLEGIINHFYYQGYRLHTMSTATSDASKGFGGGDRIQATLVFEKIGLFK